MKVTDADIQIVSRIKRAVMESFENSTLTRIQAKERMNFFIARGIFSSNHKDGLPIRDFFRHLDVNKPLHIIPPAFFKQKDTTGMHLIAK